MTTTTSVAEGETLAAAGHFDENYGTPAEREADRKWNADNGYCRHGFELGCCPAGCGFGPD